MRKHENPHDDHDSTVGSSSIALLRERFRQLYKEKELREGKRLLRLGEGFTPSKKHFQPRQYTTYSHRQPSVSSSSVPQSPLILHDSLPRQLDVPWPMMQKGYGGDANHARPGTNPWPHDVGDSSSSREYSDVDTSLHL